MSIPSFEEYKEFIEEVILDIDMTTLETYYNTIKVYMRDIFEKDELFKNINDSLAIWNDQYSLEKGYDLLDIDKKLVMKEKCFKSMINKCYRQDVIHNDKWVEVPDFSFESDYDWINPKQFYNVFSDIVRTRVSVKYLDGATYILNKINELTESLGLSGKPAYKAEEEGYYAIHYDVSYSFELPSMNFGTFNTDSKVEIQINTEIQNLIIELSWKFYEEKRMKQKKPEEKWQWNYACEEFIPNYLGHIIHYVEGMLVDVREKKR